MKKTGRGQSDWLQIRKIAVGQSNLLLAEAAIVGLIYGYEKTFVASIVLLVMAHVWAWRQTVWRRQSIVSLIHTLREASNVGNGKDE